MRDCQHIKTQNIFFIQIFTYYKKNYIELVGNTMYTDSKLTYWVDSYIIMNHIQGVQEKLCFFTIHCNPVPRLHRCKRPSKLSTQCECTVTPIGW